MARMASGDDFLGQNAPIGERFLSFPIVIEIIMNIAFFTVQLATQVANQSAPGRMSTDSDCFRVHGQDYATEVQALSHSLVHAAQKPCDRKAWSVLLIALQSLTINNPNNHELSKVTDGR